jgi:hypothetical protein
MSSGDFIEQFSKAIDKITVSEYVKVEKKTKIRKNPPEK